jgi:hypothetical protein
MAGSPVDESDEAFESGRLPPGLVRAAPASLREEGRVEAARLRDQRAVASTPAPPRGSPVLAATVVTRRRSDLPPGIICIYAIILATEDGEAVDRQIACVRKPWAPETMPRTSGDVRQSVIVLLKEHGSPLRAAALAVHAPGRAVVAAIRAEAVEALERRERTIASALPSAAKVLVQAGLFDRRAMRSLRAKQRVSGVLLEATEDRLRALGRSGALVVAAELTAVLIVCSGPG